MTQRDDSTCSPLAQLLDELQVSSDHHSKSDQRQVWRSVPDVLVPRPFGSREFRAALTSSAIAGVRLG